MAALQQQIDMREVMTIALDAFREHGYRRHRTVYNLLLQLYGTYLFRNVGFCKQLDNMLAWDFCAPEGWVEMILLSWIEDSTLIRSGFMDLINRRDEEPWWREN